jgi:hypothetical protein
VMKARVDSSAMTRFINRSTLEIATCLSLRPHMLAISRLTRSSTERNGSLHSTVR